MKSWIGWLLLAAFVATWDGLCPDTLSNGFARALYNRHQRPFVVAAWLLTSLHLFRRLPQKIDPFHYLAIPRKVGHVPH